VFEYWAFILSAETDGETGGPFASKDELDEWLRIRAEFFAREGYAEPEVTAFRLRRRYPRRVQGSGEIARETGRNGPSAAGLCVWPVAGGLGVESTPR
jgi:hypothetical protein